MTKIGLVLPIKRNGDSGFYTEDIFNKLIFQLNKSQSIYHLHIIDLTSLENSQYVENYDLNNKIWNKINISQLDLVHFVDLANEVTNNMTLSKKWEYILEKLAILNRSKAKFINTINVIKFYINKEYLIEFCDKKIPVIPTKVIAKNELNQILSDNSIVKPANGENGSFILHTEKMEKDEIELLEKQSNKFLLQPYMEEVLDGEISVLYIGKFYFHSVKKIPKGIGQKGAFQTIKQPYILSVDEKHFTEKVISALPYVPDIFRVDFIKTENGCMLMEIEAADPYHYAEFNYSNYIGALIDLYKSKLSQLHYEN